MAEFRAPCAPRLLPAPHVAYQRASPGAAADGEGDEKRGIYFSDISISSSSSRGDEECPRLPSLKRSRPDEDESFNSPMDVPTSPREDQHPLLHHLHHHRHFSAGETPSNTLLSHPHPQQPSIPDSNGHAFDAPSFGSDPHLMPESVPPAALLYPHIAGPGSFQEVLAELERTKQKNIELQGRVSSLEAKLSKDEKHVSLLLFLSLCHCPSLSLSISIPFSSLLFSSRCCDLRPGLFSTCSFQNCCDMF